MTDFPLPPPHCVTVWPYIGTAYSAGQVRLIAKAYHARMVASEGSKLKMMADLTQALAQACAVISEE